MPTHAEDMVLVPRAELDALRAENRRLRRKAGDREALKRIRSDAGEGRAFTAKSCQRHGALVSDRVQFFTCSKSQSRRLPTHFPRQTRSQGPTVSTFRRTA
jgi:hypothetical protein